MKRFGSPFNQLLKPEEKHIARSSLVILLLSVNAFVLIFPKYFGSYISTTVLILLICLSYVISIILIRQNLNELGRRILDRIALSLQFATFGVIIALFRNWVTLRVIAFAIVCISFYNFIFGIQLMFKYFSIKSDNKNSKSTEVLGFITSILNIILMAVNVIKLFK